MEPMVDQVLCRLGIWTYKLYMDAKPISPNSVDEIVDHIREEVARRKSQLNQHPVTDALSPSRSQQYSLPVEPPNIPQLPEHEGNIEHKAIYSLHDFLKFHDRDFVTNAYYGILRRPPDNKGLDGFLNAYREGTLSKLEIIGRLRLSKEGRTHRVQVRGLLPRFAMRTAYHIPVLGYIIALLASIARLPIIFKQSQQFEAFAVSQNRQQAQSFNTLGRQLSEYLQLHFQRLGMMKADTADIAELRATVTVIEERLDSALANKAEATVVGQLESNIAALGERLDRSLFHKAEANAVAELRTTLVAVSERLDRAIADQVDTNLVAELRTALVGLSERVDGALDHKVEIKELTDLAHQLADHKRNILDQDRRLRLLFEELRKRLPAPITTAQIERVLPEEQHLMDAFYVSFEDQFRGTREDIKRRVSVYLAVVEDAGAGTDVTPILDIGCGRGEWLELLRERGLASRGLDFNNWMVAQCREIGLDVVQGDAVEHLRSLAPDSLGAITGMHIVEHLPFNRVITLFDEVLRVLKPGGVVIFETPNPENLRVASCNFYCDPTHLNPIPPPTIQFVAEARGFVRSRIERLNAAVFTNPFRGIQKSSTEEVRIIRDLLEQTYFCPPDYALITYKA
jgi:SAM-dependent methyltransferase